LPDDDQQASDINCDDKSIYYLQSSQSSAQLYMANQDGQNVKTLNNWGWSQSTVIPKNLFVTDKYIYYTTAAMGSMYRISKDGGTPEKAVQNPVQKAAGRYRMKAMEQIGAAK